MHVMLSTRTQRFTGCWLLAAGAAATWWQWRGMDIDLELSVQAAFVFPFSAGMGLLLLLQPISRRALLERFGVDRPHRLAHYSWPQWLLFGLAVLAGVLNVGRILLMS